jgi:hypothetical protein
MLQNTKLMKKSIYFPLALLVAVTIAFSAYNISQPITITDQDLKILVFGQEDLQYSVAVMQRNTEKTIYGMEALVEKQGNMPSDADKLKQAKKIKEQATELYNQFERIYKIMYRNGRSEEEVTKKQEELAKLSQETRLDKYVQDGNKSLSYLLRKDLNIKDLYQKIQAFQTLVKDKTGIVDSLTLADLHKKSLSFEEFEDLNFNTNMIMALSNLSRIEANIAELESKAVTHFEGKIGGVIIKFDTIEAFISAEDDEIFEGETYRAKMFIAATSRQIKPRMTVSQGEIVVGENGIGKVTFVVPAVSDKEFGKNKVVKRKWQGAITIKKADGMDSTFKFDQEYFIKKN